MKLTYSAPTFGAFQFNNGYAQQLGERSVKNHFASWLASSDYSDLNVVSQGSQVRVYQNGNLEGESTLKEESAAVAFSQYLMTEQAGGNAEATAVEFAGINYQA